MSAEVHLEVLFPDGWTVSVGKLIVSYYIKAGWGLCGGPGSPMLAYLVHVLYVDLRQNCLYAEGGVSTCPSPLPSLPSAQTLLGLAGVFHIGHFPCLKNVMILYWGVEG